MKNLLRIAAVALIVAGSFACKDKDEPKVEEPAAVTGTETSATTETSVTTATDTAVPAPTATSATTETSATTSTETTSTTSKQ